MFRFTLFSDANLALKMAEFFDVSKLYYSNRFSWPRNSKFRWGWAVV